MPKITTIFSDVGGVLLTDGWGHESRKRAIEKFNLDGPKFEAAHAKVAAAFDMGLLTVDQYMDSVVFAQLRSFSKNDFFQFMKNESIANANALKIMSELSKSKRYFMATINNESLELNQYRIERFALGELFSAFFSSCYLKARKPEEEIYRHALFIANKKPQETLFIDDREANLLIPRKLGMNTLQFQNATQLAKDLHSYEIE